MASETMEEDEATASPEERPAGHQLVGGVKAHQGSAGYPALAGEGPHWD